jgi:GNAT superfamily N-acetyltransferase
LIIRTAQLEDADALRALHRRSSYVWQEDHVHLDAHPDLFGVDPYALAGGHVRIAALPDGALAGFATVVPGDGGECVLEDLFVEPELMRGGIGRALVEDAVARAAAAGHEAMSVIAASRTRGFYERLGFVLEGTASTQFGPALRLLRKLRHSPGRPRDAHVGSSHPDEGEPP